MTAAVLLEQSADELVTASEAFQAAAIELRAQAVRLNVDTPPEALRSAALAVQADALRVVQAALAAARAGERVATTVVLQPAPPTKGPRK